MISHINIAKGKVAASRRLKLLIDCGKITLGANRNLKIYGTLNCKSGKRMKLENRVFFGSEVEAIAHGFRPCGHCMREKYLLWKKIKSGQSDFSINKTQDNFPSPQKF